MPLPGLWPDASLGNHEIDRNPVRTGPCSRLAAPRLEEPSAFHDSFNSWIVWQDSGVNGDVAVLCRLCKGYIDPSRSQVDRLRAHDNDGITVLT